MPARSAASGIHCYRCYAIASRPIGSKYKLVRVAIHVDAHVRAVHHLAIQDLDRQRILNHALQSALQRTCAVRRDPNPQPESVARADSVSSSEMCPVFKQLPQVVQPQFQNLAQLRMAQRLEDHNIVHAVQKLRPEVLAQNSHHRFARHVEVVLGLQRISVQTWPRPGSTS